MKKTIILLIGSALILFVDQWTKMRIASSLALYEIRDIIPGLLSFAHMRNPSAVFGLMPWINHTVLLVLNGLAILLVIYFFIRIRRDRTLPAVAVSLVMGGAFGNFVDRLRMGNVIDFIDLHVGTWAWHVFNVADIAICLGIGVLILDLFLQKRDQPAEAPASSPAPETESRRLPALDSNKYDERRASMKKLLIMLAGSAFVLLLDQWTKFRVASSFVLHESREVVPGLLNFTYVYNSGAAFGVMQESNRYFFLVLSALAILFVVYFFFKIDRKQVLLAVALSLVMGGALGNVWDRFSMGHVIDFIDFHVGRRVWPTFNVADIAICVGVGVMILELFVQRHNQAPETPASESGAGTGAA